MDLKKTLNRFIPKIITTNNSMGGDLARDFRRYGNSKPLVQDWSKIVMKDKDLYKGYPYAAINNRANSVAQLAKHHLKTSASKVVQDKAKTDREEVAHPYIDIIDKSKTFANTKFWYDISTYLDLKGVYYIFALRTVAEDRVGNIQEFKLLNPYNIRRILNKETFEVGGYVETRDGMVREFSTPQIIEIRKLNPFSDEDPFAMTEAAKENQYTLSQAGDFTRHSLKNNMAAPGIISTDVVLEEQQFRNFVSRVTNQEKGVPLFGNGAGAITWDSMQTQLEKSGLDKIHEIHRQQLFAVSGVGKTMMSIEESGTTRDTAKVQKEIFMENHVIPQTELILDALNQDFKIHYESDYEQYMYKMFVDNPLGVDREAELKDIKIRDDEWKLYDKLVAEGYDRDLAARYAKGEVTLEELGDPTNEPRPNPALEAAKLKSQPPVVVPPVEEKPKKKKKDDKKKDTKKKEETPEDTKHEHDHDHIEVVRNEFDEESKGIISVHQGQLENAVIDIETRIVSDVMDTIFEQNNEFETIDDIISQSRKEESIDELAMILASFYGVLVQLHGSTTAARRTKEFGRLVNFKMNNQVKSYIRRIADITADSHVNTVLKDLRHAISKQFELEVNRISKKIAKEAGRAVTDADLVLARKRALEGASRQSIINEIKKEYKDITNNRAKAIARTESNRAFTQSQYFADLQFIKNNGLENVAYKKWITRSSNPCPICQSLEARGPIPFHENFADLGDELVVTYKDDKGKTRVLKQQIDFEELKAGNAHTNCSCRYMLILENE